MVAKEFRRHPRALLALVYFFLYGSLLFLYLCLPGTPPPSIPTPPPSPLPTTPPPLPPVSLPLPLDGRSGSELCGLRGGKDAAVHINNERPQPTPPPPPPPRRTATLQHPPPSSPPSGTHTVPRARTHARPIAMAMALAQRCHREGEVGG